jgi:hypothetical protein
VSIDVLSEKDIYDLLKPLYKSKFNDNEIIVFYCFAPLSHRFNDMPAELLSRLQKMLVYIDIPNFFCVIITNNKKMQPELDSVCKKYATGEAPIKTILHEVN